jgi:hypothetical protein
VAVNERDWEHFAAIAKAMETKATEERCELLQTTVAEQIAMGFVLGAVPRDEAMERVLDERAHDQIGLALAETSAQAMSLDPLGALPTLVEAASEAGPHTPSSALLHATRGLRRVRLRISTAQ